MTDGSIRKQRRRKKLSELVADNGGAAMVASEIGTPRSYLSAIINGGRGLGDALAQKLEKRYEMPPGWFDADDSAFWPFSQELMAKVAALDEVQKQALEDVMWAHIGALDERPKRHQSAEDPKATTAPPKDSTTAEGIVSAGKDLVVNRPSEGTTSDTETDDVGRR